MSWLDINEEKLQGESTSSESKYAVRSQDCSLNLFSVLFKVKNKICEVSEYCATCFSQHALDLTVSPVLFSGHRDVKQVKRHRRQLPEEIQLKDLWTLTVSQLKANATQHKHTIWSLIIHIDSGSQHRVGSPASLFCTQPGKVQA